MFRVARDVHVYTRMAGWLLFGGLNRADSFTFQSTGSEECKSYGKNFSTTCPYMLDETLTACPCEWCAKIYYPLRLLLAFYAIHHLSPRYRVAQLSGKMHGDISAVLSIIQAIIQTQSACIQDTCSIDGMKGNPATAMSSETEWLYRTPLSTLWILCLPTRIGGPRIQVYYQVHTKEVALLDTKQHTIVSVCFLRSLWLIFRFLTIMLREGSKKRLEVTLVLKRTECLRGGVVAKVMQDCHFSNRPKRMALPKIGRTFAHWENLVTMRDADHGTWRERRRKMI